MIEQVNNMAEIWWCWMWPMFWQVGTLVVFISAVDLLIRKHVWPQVRYALWMLVLVKLILPPTFSLSTGIISQVRTQASQWAMQLRTVNTPADFPSVGQSTEIIPHITDIGIESSPIRGDMPDNKIAGPPEQAFSSDVVESGSYVKLQWQAYAMAVWLIGVVALALWVVVRLRKLRYIHDSNFCQTDLPQGFGPLLTQTAKKFHLRKLPEIVLSGHIASPAVFGTFRPVLVLPAATIHHLSHNRTEHILLHELAHIKRGDLMVNTFYTLLQIVYWFNPLLWLVRRRLHHLRELCCDATVARILRDKTTDYRETILETAQRLLAKPVEPGIGLLGLFETSSRLLVRLKWLEKKTWRHRGLRIGTVCAVVVLMITCILPMAKAKTKEKSSVQSEEATQIDPNSEPSSEVTNTIRGFVTDKLGRPRGNVYITTSLNKIRDAIRTDERGEFVLEVTQPEQKNWVAYSHASQAVGLFTIPQDYVGQLIRVILDIGVAEAEGRVVGSDGKGLANRKVELITNTKQGVAYYSECYRKTDEYGNYSSSIPCGSSLTVQARLADANESERKYITKTTALSDNQIFVPMPTLVVGEGRPEETDDGKVLYSGRVLNEEGQPMHSVKVKLSFRMLKLSGWVKSVSTDAYGRWKRRLPKNLSDLTVGLLHPEYIKQSWQKVSLAELLNGTNVMVMKRGLRLRGIVKNQQGEPIENALVDTGGGEGTTVFSEVIENCTTPRTLADGSFSVGGLAAGSKDIVVSAVGYAPRVVPVEIEDGMEPIEVSLKSGGTYVGQVVDIDGNPIEGVKISVGEWSVGNRRKALTRITKTDSQGYFSIGNLPDEGKLQFHFGGKRDSGLMGFRKEVPEDLSGRDKIVMYKTPVFVGKVIDAETEEVIKNFTLTVGIDSAAFGDTVSWSRYRKDEVTSEDGTFSRTWGGYGITYPFDGLCCLKVEAKGYLPEVAPPTRLGEKYEPCVIRLTKAEPRKGTVVDHKGNPAVKAEVGWAGPEKIAFIKNGTFDTTGFSYQVEPIVRTDSDGLFELPPSREQGFIMALHKTGYASVTSEDFKNGSQIRLIPWARIEVTIDSTDKSGREFVLGINQAALPEEDGPRPIRWLFDRTSFSDKRFIIDYVPSTPLQIGQIIQSRQSNSVYIDPQPGEAYRVQFGDKGITVAEKVLPSLLGKVLPDLNGIKIDFPPEQTKGKMILVCFWDMNQRPSRNCVSQLARQAERLKQKGVTIVALQASKVDENALDKWIKEHSISFPVGIVRIDEEETLHAWGVKSLPWLILTDRNHIVRTEGFALLELDGQLRANQ